MSLRKHLQPIFQPLLPLLLAYSTTAATFTVTTTADTGPGSLRDAIVSANAQLNSSGPDLIQFAIPGSGPQTIQLLFPLPEIQEPVVIDATTQNGYTGTPLVELNGASAGPTANGLYIQTSNCTVRGLALNRFAFSGIRIEQGSDNTLLGNYIGTGTQGTTSLGNQQTGIFIFHGAGNRIGGTNTGEPNLISGNIGAGIYIFECDSRSNIIQGNYIGTTASGLMALANRTNGIVIDNAPGNLVGGGSPAERNIISGNGQSGILVYGGCANGNVISGNYIGTDISGSAALSNTVDGVTIYTASNNIVGGTTTGSGNLISGNGARGLTISGPAAPGNLVQGNLVGTDATGRLALGNNLGGVTIIKSSSNVIGGRIVAARNIISGNRQSGVVIGTNSFGNRVEGNFVGVDITGTNRLGNLFSGVTIQDAIGNFVGSEETGGRNILSGNIQNGVFMTGDMCRSNSVQGNFIGTDLTGGVAARNAQAGVWVESSRNVIGGPGSLPGNVISGNGQDGVLLVNNDATGNQVQGNYVGTDITGTKRLSNQRAGVGISGAPGNTIGGVDGSTGNLISGNGDAGIYLVGTAASGNQISGNRIGTDAAGRAALGNSLEGIYLQGAPTNTIGALGTGGGNVISANFTRGIFLTNSSWNTIQGNLVGTATDGTSNLGNTFHAIEFEATANNNVVGPDNRIAYSKGIYAGVRVRDGSVNNLVLGNAIFGNGALGIDLGPVGVNANDNCDSDTGANMRQNFPVLTNVYTGHGTTVRGTLNSGANQVYVVQFYANAACDSSGNGEGQMFLGQTSVTTGGNCTANFSAKLPVTISAGQAVTATATDPNNNTSEFSTCLPAVAEPTLAVNTAGLPTTGRLTLSWPTATSTGFSLQQADNLNEPIQWTAVTNAPVLLDGNLSVSLTATNGTRFFRLILP